MRIADYFKYIQTLWLSPLERVQLYERFLGKSQRKALLKRRLTYTKYAGATLWCAVMITVVSGYIMRDTNGWLQITTENDIFTAYQKTPGSYVEAMTLGTILHSQGDIVLSKDGQKVAGNLIANNEKVILQEWATLEFLISSNTKAKITWPAAFELQDLGQTSDMHDIAINMLYGDYLEVQTQEAPIEHLALSSQESNQLPENIIIKTKNFEVKRLRSSEKLNLVMTKGTEDEHTIQNNGGELVVEKFIKDKKVFSSVKSQQTVAVGEEVTLLAQQAQELTKAITDSSISTSYTLETTGDALAAKVSDSWASSETPADVVLLSPGKQVVSEDQTKRLTELLNPSLLMNSIETLVVTTLNNTPDNGQSAANSIALKIKSVYDTLGISLDSQIIGYYSKSNLSVKQLTLITDQLIAKIEANYYVGPTYTNRLKWIMAWLLFLESTTPVDSSGSWEALNFEQLIEQYNLKKFQGYLLLK